MAIARGRDCRSGKAIAATPHKGPGIQNRIPDNMAARMDGYYPRKGYVNGQTFPQLRTRKNGGQEWP